MRGADHAEMCIRHMEKITTNDTHSHDDICDTAYDAVKIALIDGVVTHGTLHQERNDIVKTMAANHSKLVQLRANSYV